MSNLIRDAEMRIGEILAQLERDTGSVVREIGVVDVEVTNMASERRELQRRVRLELERLPGTKWAEGSSP